MVFVRKKWSSHSLLRARRRWDGHLSQTQRANWERQVESPWVLAIVLGGIQTSVLISTTILQGHLGHLSGRWGEEGGFPVGDSLAP